MSRAILAALTSLCIAVLAVNATADESDPDQLFADLFEDVQDTEIRLNLPASNQNLDSQFDDLFTESNTTQAVESEPVFPVSLRFPGEVTGAESNAQQTFETTFKTSTPPPTINVNEPSWMQLRDKGVSYRVTSPVVVKTEISRAEMESHPTWIRERDIVHSIYTNRARGTAQSTLATSSSSTNALRRIPRTNATNSSTNALTQSSSPQAEIKPQDLRKAFAPIAAFVSAFKSPRANSDNPIRSGTQRSRTRTQTPATTQAPPSTTGSAYVAQTPTQRNTRHRATNNPVQTEQPNWTVPKATSDDPESVRNERPAITEPVVEDAVDEPSIEELLLLEDSVADANENAAAAAASDEPSKEQVVAETVAPPRMSKLWAVMGWLPILGFIPIILLVHKQRKQRDDREKRRLRAAQTNMQFPTRAEKRMAKMVKADVDQTQAEQEQPPQQPAVVAEVTQQLEVEIDRAAATPPSNDVDESAPNPDWLTLGQSLVDEEITAAEKAAAGSPDDFAMPEEVTNTIGPDDIKLPVEVDEWAFEIETPPEAAPVAEPAATDGYVSEDLKKLHGIGPAIEKVLHAAKIYRFSDLAATDAAQLLEILKQAGHPFNTVDPTTWAVQAALAMDGDWGRLVLYKMHENEWDVPGADLAAVPANDMMNDLAAMMADLQTSVAKKANTVPETTPESGTTSTIDFESYFSES